MKSKAIVMALLALLVCACGPDVVIEPVGERDRGGLATTRCGKLETRTAVGLETNGCSQWGEK
jgi:hypothetical protein